MQLLSYLAGYDEHMALHREAMQRSGEEFDLRRYHHPLLSLGSPSVKYVQAGIFGLPVE